MIWPVTVNEQGKCFCTVFDTILKSKCSTFDTYIICFPSMSLNKVTKPVADLLNDPLICMLSKCNGIDNHVHVLLWFPANDQRNVCKINLNSGSSTKYPFSMYIHTTQNAVRISFAHAKSCKLNWQAYIRSACILALVFRRRRCTVFSVANNWPHRRI